MFEFFVLGALVFLVYRVNEIHRKATPPVKSSHKYDRWK